VDINKPLWTCPKCGAKLVTPNMWHACGAYTVEKFLEGKSPKAREMFQRFADLIGKCGPVTTAPAKTRVAFMVRVRFAGVSNVSDRGITIAFALRRPLKNPRIFKVVKYNPRWYGHYVRIKSLDELDDELATWLCEAYKVGEQKP
jgi:hypothetical protein